VSVSRVADGVYCLGQRVVGHVRAFLLEDDDGSLTAIDTLRDPKARPFHEALEQMGKAITDIQHIVLSHAHPAHLGGLAHLKAQSGATVYSHAWETDIIAGERIAQPITPIPMRPIRNYFRVYPYQLAGALGVGRHAPCPVEKTLEDGDRVGPLQVLYSPGHSPGHLAFHWEARRFLCAGDAITTYPRLDSGWPALTLNHRQHRDSLRRLADLAAVDVVGVGHGDPITKDARAAVRQMADRAAGAVRG
jgi:glyoxylase-like metal-dependent hydrolase (beta-lactamase superfamily II)